MTATAALLEEVTDHLYALHTDDTEAAAAARRDFESRRGRVYEDDELWEAWSAAFTEWYVVERVADGSKLPPAAVTYRELLAAGDPRASMVRALLTSQRSLYEVRAIGKGTAAPSIQLVDLFGGAEFHVSEQRAMVGVEVGDVAELRLIGVNREVRFGRTFIYHPKTARAAIVERARAMLGKGATRRDVIDKIAELRSKLVRYRHMPPARVYELGSRIMG